LEATRLIRQTVVKQPVIIALTAAAMDGDEKSCLEAGMNDYLGKPIQLDELMSKLELWHQRTAE
jgi:two-component system sensor histidine kinase/response regulator